MQLLSNLARQFEQIYDTVDVVCVAALVYLVARGWKHLKGHRFGVLALALPVLSYFLLFTFMAGSRVQERYYRPVLPFFVALSALGLHCLTEDIKNRKVVYGILGVIFVGLMVAGLREPVRAHRRPQTEAGLWLKNHDPDYKGFVLSNYSQPVFYAGMRHFDTIGTEELFLELLARGEPFKYMILDGEMDGKEAWAGQYVVEHDWPRIYYNQERDLRIHENPQCGEQTGRQGRQAPDGPLL